MKARSAKAGTAAASSLYTTKINHVGALLPDTKVMLAHWDLDASVMENLDRMRVENVFAKASRSRIPEMLETFRERYLSDPDVLRALVALSDDDAPDVVLDPILYVLAARADPLVRDVVVEFLASIQARGQTSVRPDDVSRWLHEQVAAGRAQRPWSDATIQRLARGLVSTLRDFGVLQGKATKQLAPVYLSLPGFALLACLFHRTTPSGEKLLHHPDWQLFFLTQAAVERLFLEAHQEGLLQYQAAGRVIRVEFPSRSLEEYAHAVARRAL